MKDELDKQLCEKYPKIFAQRHLPMDQTCMCWGFACGDGWFNIIDTLCELIQNRIDNRLKDIARCNEWHAMRNAAIAGDWAPFNLHYEEVYGKEKINDPKWTEWLEGEKRKLVQPEIPKWMVVKEPIQQVEAVQVKEKFGGLRFYYEGGDDYIGALVNFAESMSYVTCEVCGNSGTTRAGGWVLTLCDEHHNDRSWKDRG